MGFVEWIKSHPLYDVLGLVGVFLLVYVLRSSGGGGGGTVVVAGGGGQPSDAVQTANINASAQLQAVQAGATLQADNIQAQVAVNRDNNTTQLQLGGIAGQVAALQSNNAAGVAQSQVAGQVALGESALSAQTTLARIQTDGEVALAGVNSRTAIDINEENNATQRTQITASQLALQYQVGAERDIALSNNSTAVANNETAARLQLGINTNNTRVQLAGIDATKTVALSNITGQVAVNASNNEAYTTLGTAYISAAGAAEHDATNATFQETQNYINHLGFNLIPGGTTTVGAISAAQPGNTTGAILAGVGGIFSGIGKAATGLFGAGGI